MPEGDECEQELENLFEETVGENLSNLVKKNVTQAQEAQSPNQDESKETQDTLKWQRVKTKRKY